MRFYNKIFLGFLLTSVFTVGTICTFSFFYFGKTLRKNFLQVYQAEMSQVADMLVSFEHSIEKRGINALYVLREIDKTSNLPSNPKLAELAKELAVSNFFITNAKGKFIRSTNGDIKINLFYLCADYKNLIKGNTKIFKTPIVPSSAEPTVEPYKYIMIPNYNRTKILEASVHLNFINTLLMSSLKSMPYFLNLRLYTPSGKLLGSVYRSSKKIPPDRNKIIKLEKDIVTDDSLNCCECRIKNISSSNGKYYYHLEASISTIRIDKIINNVFGVISIIFIISIGICALIARIISRRLVSRLQTLHKQIDQIADRNSFKGKLYISGSDEIAKLGKHINRLLKQISDDQKILLRAEKEKVIASVASQVAHDIRSPLTALESIIQYLTQFPEKERLMIKHAVHRIKDIANNLLIQYKRDKSSLLLDNQEKVSNEFILNILERIISEKRAEFSSGKIFFEMKVNNDAYGIFAKIQLVEFQRVLSNLINNAVKSITEKGMVSIKLGLAKNGFVIISISDTGCGIPEEQLTTILKSGSLKGTGLGLAHAKRCIDSWGGEIAIRSKVNVGTTIRVIVPQSRQPNWFASRILINEDSIIAVLDDDESIHGVWKKRLTKFLEHTRVICFYNPNELIGWHQTHDKENIIYLIDYEFIKYNLNGLDVIEKLHITNQAMLVTSQYEDPDIRKRCEKLGIEIIPKSFSIHIPIEKIYTDPDIVLIDDNKSLTDIWKFQCEKAGKRIAIFNKISEFRRVYHLYDKKTMIYIDSNLGYNLRGEIFAKELYKKGYKNLYLTTGYNSKDFNNACWLKGIVTKKPPF
ncbi:MAG: hypothetical protein AMJ43_01420 [Coxiella sp. DG_40]|nr:MAG: hypothetical protein AMJ43_01420 [Coxiella sp. DG_40]